MRLKFAPESLAGLSAWKRQLELYPGWQELLTILLEVNVTGKKLIKNFATVLFEVLEKFDVQQWPAADELAWVVHKQAWDGLHQALRGLSEGRQFVSIQQFAQLLQNAMNSYFLPQPLTFQQQVNVTAMEQLVGMDQYCIFLLGMTEDSFPSKIKRDWLTQQIQTDHSLDLYDQILRSAVQIQLSYPETNLDNSVNIASPIFPEEHEHFEAAPTIIMPGSFGDYPAGQLAETEIIERIIQRYQQKSLSVSRLNLYATCPYKFFCAELLGFNCRTSRGIRDYCSRRRQLTALSFKAILGATRKNTDSRNFGAGLLRAQPLFDATDSWRMIDKFNQQDIELVNSSEFYPRYLEQSFDNLKITSPTGSIRLRGVIDRIDLNSDGEYVIYDYKSGGSPSTTEIIEGIDIQLQAYTLAAANIITDGNLVGIGFYTLRDGKRSGLWSKDHNRRLGIRGGRAVLEPDQWQNITNDFMMTLSNYVSRIFAGYFPIEPQKKGACDYCDFRVICRREGVAVGFKPTPEQAEAISIIDRDLMVVAGAGSGKTKVLVERYVNLVEQGFKLNQILAITFTRKAALEMKERIRQTLPDMEQAQISTIHSFCQKVVADHPLQAKIDPHFRMFEEWESKALLKLIAMEVVTQAYSRVMKKFKCYVKNTDKRRI